jgi:hypothetical protein
VKELPDPPERKLEWSLKNIKALLRKAHDIVKPQSDTESTITDDKVFEWVVSNMDSKAEGNW